MTRNKFDRLANTHKSTGDPRITIPVRRAKRIAKSILARAHSRTLGIAWDSESTLETCERSQGRVATKSPQDQLVYILHANPVRTMRKLQRS